MRNIKQLREYLNLSQRQFAEKFGIPLKTIQNWESKTRTPPEYVIKMANEIVELEDELSGVHSLLKICNLADKVSYILKEHRASSLLLHSNGRTLEELQNNSIDCIITDHPYQLSQNKSGTRNFTCYDCFQYELEDFQQKARVLKEGCYLAEFLPVRSAHNKDYLNAIEIMAEEVGLQVYAYITWTYNDKAYTGRTRKGKNQIVIFSKGVPRKLSKDNVAAYRTTEMLEDIMIPLPLRNRNHQSEKPLELYEYLIKMLTKKGEIILDQYGGSCNALKAAVNMNRNAIVYEIDDKYVEKAVKRFDLKRV